MTHDLELASPTALERTTPEHVPWQRALDVFLDSRSDSPHTRRAYKRQVSKAMTALGVHALAHVTGEGLAAWRAQLTGSTLAAGSQAQGLAAMRSFLRWGRAFGLHRLPDELVRETLRTPRASVVRPYQVLSEPEIARLLAVDSLERDRALVAVLLGAGLRAAEVVALDVGDVHEDQDGEVTLHVRAGKGRKDRVVPIRLELAQVIRHYLATSSRRLGDSGPLFLSHDPARRRPDGRLSTRAVGYLVERLCHAARIEAKRISPHSARHTYALRALRAGANVVAVQKLLGHASVSTTQRYVDHLAVAELRDAVAPLPLGPQCDTATERCSRSH